MGGGIKSSTTELAGPDAKKSMYRISEITSKSSVPNVFNPLASPWLYFVQLHGHLDIFLKPDVEKALHFSKFSHDNTHLAI